MLHTNTEGTINKVRRLALQVFIGFQENTAYPSKGSAPKCMLQCSDSLTGTKRSKIPFNISGNSELVYISAFAGATSEKTMFNRTHTHIHEIGEFLKPVEPLVVMCAPSHISGSIFFHFSFFFAEGRGAACFQQIRIKGQIPRSPIDKGVPRCS